MDMLLEHDVSRSVMAALGLAFGVAIYGCSSDGSRGAVTQTTPVEVAGVYEGVEFYPACGNETLRHQGVTWYPVVQVGFDPMDPALQRRVHFDEVLAVDREDSPVVGVHGFARIPSPGERRQPQDEIGTGRRGARATSNSESLNAASRSRTHLDAVDPIDDEISLPRRPLHLLNTAPSTRSRHASGFAGTATLPSPAFELVEHRRPAAR